MTAYHCEVCGCYAGPTGLCGGHCINCWVNAQNATKGRTMSDLAAYLDTLEHQAEKAAANGEHDYARGLRVATAMLRDLAPKPEPEPEPEPIPFDEPDEPPPLPSGV